MILACRVHIWMQFNLWNAFDKKNNQCWDSFSQPCHGINGWDKLDKKCDKPFDQKRGVARWWHFKKYVKACVIIQSIKKSEKSSLLCKTMSIKVKWLLVWNKHFPTSIKNEHIPHKETNRINTIEINGV